MADGFAGAVTRSWGPFGARSGPGSVDRFPSDCTQLGPYARPRVRTLSVIQSVKCKWFTLIGPSLPRGAPPPLPPTPLRSRRCYHRVLFPQPSAITFFLPCPSFSSSSSRVFLTPRGPRQGYAFPPYDPRAPRTGPPICSAHVCDQPPAERYIIRMYACIWEYVCRLGRTIE